MSDWYAIYTKSRSEKKVATRLQEIGISVYCPTQTVMRQWSDRKKKVTEPVFRSYVFVQFKDETERLAILQTYGVVNFVRYLKQIAVIQEKEIELIKQFLGEFTEVEVAMEEIQVGDEVAVKTGALMGQKGIVKSTDGKKVVLILDSLGISLSATVKAFNLDRLVSADTIEEKKTRFHF